ncbi:hypothetical protein ACQJBY_011866 [Aegilops geniculata]
MGNRFCCSSVRRQYPRKKEGSPPPPAETWSRCSTESVTATHNFEVTGFSSLEGIGAGKFLRSGKFTVGGCEWDLHLYPDGWKEEHKPVYASVFLSLREGETGTSGVTTKYTLTLLDQHGRVSNLTTQGSQGSLQHTFHSTTGYWGFEKFVEKSKLRQLLALTGDSFTVRCVLTVIKKGQAEDVHMAVAPLPQSNLHKHFLDMLKGGEGADVTFTVAGQSFLAHRCVLAARSPVFKAELFGKMNETLAQSIKIDGMEPSIFEALLHFIYTDSLSDDRHADDRHTEMQHLLVAADRYGVDRLMAICEGKLCRSISVQTVATTLALAEQHHCMHLKRACLEFLSSRDVRQAVKETDGFKHLVTSCPSVILEIFDKPPPQS